MMSDYLEIWQGLTAVQRHALVVRSYTSAAHHLPAPELDGTGLLDDYNSLNDLGWNVVRAGTLHETAMEANNGD